MLSYDSSRRLGPERIPTATWGEFLGDSGFSSVSRIREIVAWWRLVLSSRDVKLVLADYAPLAMFAARSLGIKSIATGTGYGLPPPNMLEFPVLSQDATIRLHDEKVLVENLNTVADEIGMPRLASFPELYRADLQLVRTLPFLDPYEEVRENATYLPPVTDISPVLAQGGEEVFVYFSTIEFNDPGVVEALANLPLPRRGYLPAPPPGVAERLIQSGMILEDRPVPVSKIAERSRILLNAGQHGILCLGLYAGLPQVCLFQHREQLFHAQRAADQGVARVVHPREREERNLVTIIMETYHDAAMREKAHQIARQLKAEMNVSPDLMLRNAIAPIRTELLKTSL
ncbi:glycosyltransferase [Thioclava sp. FR2]|uniref:glycosyltransferase n=1 Tax=Thioclava sp. FR2 TaxID=3445780 RepID=UPI003EBABC33